MLCLQENAGREVERRGRAHSPHIHREQGVHLQVEEGQWNERQNIPFAYFLTRPAAHLQIEEVQWNEWQNIPFAYLTRCSHDFNHVAGLERLLQLFTFFSWFC